MTDKKDSHNSLEENIQAFKETLGEGNKEYTEQIEKQLNEIKETLEWEEANKDKIKAELSGKTETKPKPRPHKALQLSAFDLSELTLEGIEEIKKELEKDGLDFYSMSTFLTMD